MNTTLNASNRSNDTYNIKTDTFEGPFHLLLSLIEERKFFINDLSLAQVTEDFLRHISQLESRNPNEISQFVVVAATLILIKSKSLLPELSLTKEEEGDIKDLEERLRLYELYINLSKNIKVGFGERIIFAPLERKRNTLIFLPDAKITRVNMMTFAMEALEKVPKKQLLPKIEVKKVISLEEMLSRLSKRIEESLQISFRDFAGRGKTREEKVVVIIGFLAMLELVRQGMLSAMQEDSFGEIELIKN